MAYRTRTYIAADWDADSDAVDRLHRWNEGERWSLSFTDAHELTQSRDSSLNCSIKVSLKERMDHSKTFVLIVGQHTASLRSGACYLCGSFNSYTYRCAREHNVDQRSYVDFECAKAKEAGIKVVVLYKSDLVLRELCPEVLRGVGIHRPMCYRGNGGRLYWDYRSVRGALEA